MDHWFTNLAAKATLPASALRELKEKGFLVLPGPVPEAKLPELASAYDGALLHADPDDVKVGGSTGFVICCRVIEQPFRLSTMHARTLRPQTPAQRLHVDFASDGHGWPMVGFILMIEEFRPENGATLFVPGSQGEETLPVSLDPLTVCGPAGSMIVFNGSVWHGHGANETDQPRRSIQGAYIRRNECSGENLPARMSPETLDRIGPLARYLLAL